MISGSAEVFSFDSYKFDEQSLEVKLHYSCGVYKFCERIKFENVPDPQNLHTAALQNSLKLLHLTAGISYYKAFVQDVKTMSVSYDLPNEIAEYLNNLYEDGLGEFFYANNLPPFLPARFIGSSAVVSADDAMLEGYIVGLGGGKDSLTAIALLGQIGESPLSTFGVNANELLNDQAEILGTKHLRITRTLDIEAIKKITPIEPSAKVPNGHIPISSILGAIGLVGGVLSGISSVVVAVERSANEPTVTDYQGKSINHQYSKSSEFEKLFDLAIKQWVGKNAGYFSLLRPLKELDIMRLFFALKLDEQFEGKYTSCNKSIGFTLGQKDKKLWCGECDKCAFIFLLITGAGRFDDAIKIFGRDLLADEKLKNTYDALLGLTDSKPFDCVGEIDEARESMTTAKEFSEAARSFIYPQAVGSETWHDDHNIPDNLSFKLKTKILELLASDK
jgi:UDP-N-acetyl-alpha-D-muramoyl-L-alanyl-L-glutamate epimerase